IGYVPLATIQPPGVNTYGGYGLGYGFGYGYGLPFPMPSVAAFAPWPAATFLYTPRRFTPLFASRPGLAGRVGVRSLSPSISRPISPSISRPTSRPVLQPAAPTGLTPRVGGTVGVRPGMGARPVGRR